MLTEKLILLVKEKQFLYDSSHSDHKNKNIVSKAWREISKEMGTENAQHWAKKWRSLRYHYKRFKRDTKPNKKWKWARQMSFLDDYTFINLKKSINVEGKNESAIVKHALETKYKSNTEKVVQQLRYQNLENTKSSDIQKFLQFYAGFFKNMPSRFQRSLKFKMAALFASYQSKLPQNYAAIISSSLGGPGINQNSLHGATFQQSMQQINTGESATNKPISVIIQAHLKQLFGTCEQLYTLNLYDNSHSRAKFEAMRTEYETALYQLLAFANGWEKPVSLPTTLPIVEIPGLDWSRYNREFEEMLFIAQGGCGTVCKARHRLDGAEYAVKKVVINSYDLKAIMLHLKEVKTIASLNHPNIVNYKTAWLEPMIESNINRVKIDSQSVEFDSNAASSSHSNWKKSMKNPILKNVNENESSSLIISFKNSNRFHFNKNDSSMSVDNSKYSDEGSTSSEGKASLFTNEIYENCSRINLKFATLYIQMSYCQQTLAQWLEIRNRHIVNVSRRGVEDFTLHHTYSIEPTNLDALDVTYPKAWTHLDVVTDMFTQLVKGLQYIHSLGITHHDIKPSNVFVTKSEDGCTVQLGDFDLACSTPKSHSGYGLGTPSYAAPEQLKGKCNPKSDMYSLGIILLEMVDFFSTGMERVITLEDLRRGRIPARLTANYPKIAHIIGKLVHRFPNKRPSSAQLLNELKDLAGNEDENVKILKEELSAKDEEIAKLTRMLAELNTRQSNRTSAHS